MVAIMAFLYATPPVFAQNIQVSDLLGTVWESTKYGSSYKDRTIEQLQFIGTEHVRMASAMYLNDRFLSDAAEVRKYSIVNSSTIRVYFTAVTDKGKQVESYYDFRLKNESGSYSFVDVTEHYSTHKEPFEYKFRHNVKVSVSPLFLHLSKGETSNLKISVSPEDAYVSINSDNPNVATVNSYGFVTAIDNGKATITVSLGQKVAKCVVEVKPPYIPVTSVILNYNTLNLYPGETAKLKFLANLSNGKTSRDKEVNWVSDNSSVTVSSTGEITVAPKSRTGTATITVTCEDKTASCIVNILSGKSKTKVGAVDMGLSVKWASSNLRETGLAREPSDVGDYYAWGEIAAKAKYDWKTYKWKEGSVFRYHNDGNRRLQTDDDVASWKLEEGWHIPTHEEFKELLDNCKIKPKIQNHVTGLLFTSKITGNSIFLPATTQTREGYSDYYLGNYWCSDMSYNKPWCVRLTFRALLDNPDYELIENPDPHRGYSIRPVKD